MSKFKTKKTVADVTFDELRKMLSKRSVDIVRNGITYTLVIVGEHLRCTEGTEVRPDIAAAIVTSDTKFSIVTDEVLDEDFYRERIGWLVLDDYGDTAVIKEVADGKVKVESFSRYSYPKSIIFTAPSDVDIKEEFFVKSLLDAGRRDVFRMLKGYNFRDQPPSGLHDMLLWENDEIVESCGVWGNGGGDYFTADNRQLSMKDIVGWSGTSLIRPPNVVD